MPPTSLVNIVFLSLVKKNSLQNATYMSQRIQNDIIYIIGSAIPNTVLKHVNKAKYFSILAVETMNISDIEQLYIYLIYISYANSQPVLREDYIGFIALDKSNAKNIADQMMSSLQEWDLNKLIRQGYDGTMAGHISGVQEIERDIYKKAVFIQYVSHRLIWC